MRKVVAVSLIALLMSAVRGDTAGNESTKTGATGIKPAFSSEVSIKVEGAFRIIRANGIPNHDTGQFPGRGNPNTIAPQRYEYKVAADPKPAEAPTRLRMQPFGIAVNGVVFDPGAAEWWNGDRAWQYEPLGNGAGFLGVDASHAHVQPSGAYHYHGIPTALVSALAILALLLDDSTGAGVADDVAIPALLAKLVQSLKEAF